ncbi:MAG: bifunctional DNA primase/polymerase, partial [Hyphomicrobium sp.]
MVEQTNTNDAGALRQRLKQAGFCPLPLNGKAPSMKGWQTKLDANADEIRLWEKLYPYHTNTGVLTRLTPAIDIDLTHPEAAEAVEALAREHFEQRGYVMVRIGKAPKRAILLRTDEPFQKLTSTLTAQDGSTQKIEILADGQQLAVHGMHPETKRGYAWHGGEPWSITREELPYVCEQDARGFLADARKLLIEQFGFKQSERAKTDGDAQQANNQKGGHDPADWGALFARIRAGETLHDPIRDLAASFVVSGMTDKRAIEQIRALMTAS